jgi:hypothetical protein
VEDLYEAHRRVGVGLHLFGEQPTLQRTWASLLVCHLAATGQRDVATSVATRRRYQAQQWGRASGDSFLLELLPLPTPTTRTFAGAYARTGLPHLRDRSTYRRHWLPRRVELLQRLTTRARLAQRPLRVVAYGRTSWPEFRAVFGVGAAPLREVRLPRGKATALLYEDDDLRVAFAWHPVAESSTAYWLTLGDWLAGAPVPAGADATPDAAPESAATSAPETSASTSRG